MWLFYVLNKIMSLLTAESNPILKILHLEDINLANCHQEILHLLENSMLEGKSGKSCWKEFRVYKQMIDDVFQLQDCSLKTVDCWINVQ